jgi:hypothetical protein
MHNESLSDRIVDGTAEEVNLNGSKPALGVDVTMSPLVQRVAIAATGVALGVIIGRKLYFRPLVIKGAQKVEEVAEQVEEAAVRG